jgi:hypothetical protein
MKTDWPAYIALGEDTVSGTLKAVLGDCPIVHEVTLKDGTALPSLMHYDPQTFILSINPTDVTEVGVYTLVVKASIRNAVTPLKQETKELTPINIVKDRCYTFQLNFNQAFSEHFGSNTLIAQPEPYPVYIELDQVVAFDLPVVDNSSWPTVECQILIEGHETADKALLT